MSARSLLNKCHKNTVSVAFMHLVKHSDNYEATQSIL